MTIKQLIAELNKYKNKDLKVIITCGNEAGDTLSTSDFELFNYDEESDYMEIFIDEEHCSRQV